MSTEPQWSLIFHDCGSVEKPPTEDLEKGPVRDRRKILNILPMSQWRNWEGVINLDKMKWV